MTDFFDHEYAVTILHWVLVMTDVEILRAAENIIRRATPGSDHEREVFRDTITGLVWARVDLTIAEFARTLQRAAAL